MNYHAIEILIILNKHTFFPSTGMIFAIADDSIDPIIERIKNPNFYLQYRVIKYNGPIKQVGVAQT